MVTPESRHERPMNRLARLAPLLPLALLALVLLASGAPHYLSLDQLRRHQLALREFVLQHPALSVAAFTAAVTVIAASGLPGGIVAVMLAGGWLFGTGPGAALEVAGVTLGAAALYGAVHSSLGPALRERAERSGGRLKSVLDGLRQGVFGYILTLRLLPFPPFGLVSVAAALAGAPFRSYVLATALGVLPAALIYSALGAGVARLIAHGQRPHALLTPSLVTPLLALALLSLAATILAHVRARTGRGNPAP
jgi:uncharacterized membrane protein YdjX (TVP38/TMEM64 family)